METTHQTLTPRLPPSSGKCVHNDSAHGTALHEGNCRCFKRLTLEGMPGEGMRCVDHTSSFIAYSGAPKQDSTETPCILVPKAPARWHVISSMLIDPNRNQRCYKPLVPCWQVSSEPDSTKPTHGTLYSLPRANCLQ